MQFIKILVLAASSLLFCLNALAVERVVVLNPAVSSILNQLKLDTVIVGVTYNDTVFPDRTKVGSHLRPNLELVKALKPDLLIVGSKKAFPDQLTDRFGAAIFRYDPRSLDEIKQAILQLGNLLNKSKEAKNLVDKENARLKQLKLPSQPVTVVFEVSERPLKLAGQQNIVTSIITAAGGINLIEANRKHVLLSPEKVLILNPQLYIYQNGPMNKNPETPAKRNYFRSLDSAVFEVDQVNFTRPGLNVFEAVQILNRQFLNLSTAKQP